MICSIYKKEEDLIAHLNILDFLNNLQRFVYRIPYVYHEVYIDGVNTFFK